MDGTYINNLKPILTIQKSFVSFESEQFVESVDDLNHFILLFYFILITTLTTLY